MFKRNLTNQIDSINDLKVLNSGIRKAAIYGPLVRDHFFMLLNLSGKGILETKHGSYDITENQGFLIYPHEPHYYFSDSNNPWYNYRFSFHGLKTQKYIEKTGLTPHHPVFFFQPQDFITNFMQKITEPAPFEKPVELILLSFLYYHLAKLIEARMEQFPEDQHTRREKYVKLAINYMELNYAQKIMIEDVAHSVGLNMSYFCTLFKQKLNVSPFQYLTQIRIEKACQFLKQPDITITEIAHSVGFDDPLHFSRVFKRIKKIPPSEYRKNEPL